MTDEQYQEAIVQGAVSAAGYLWHIARILYVIMWLHVTLLFFAALLVFNVL